MTQLGNDKEYSRQIRREELRAKAKGRAEVQGEQFYVLLQQPMSSRSRWALEQAAAAASREGVRGELVIVIPTNYREPLQCQFKDTTFDDEEEAS